MRSEDEDEASAFLTQMSARHDYYAEMPLEVTTIEESDPIVRVVRCERNRQSWNAGCSSGRNAARRMGSGWIAIFPNRILGAVVEGSSNGFHMRRYGLDRKSNHSKRCASGCNGRNRSNLLIRFSIRGRSVSKNTLHVKEFENGMVESRRNAGFRGRLWRKAKIQSSSDCLRPRLT